MIEDNEVDELVEYLEDMHSVVGYVPQEVRKLLTALIWRSDENARIALRYLRRIMSMEEES